VQARFNVVLFVPNSATSPISNTTTTANLSQTEVVQPLNGEGRATQPFLGQLRVEQPPPLFKIWQTHGARIGDVWLRAFDFPHEAAAGTTIQFELAYEPARSDLPNATAFVHLLDAAGNVVTQSDVTPHAGFYPTSAWLAGECVRERFVLTVPPGTTGKLRAVTGFYTADGVRFKTTSASADDLVDLGVVNVR
jgi:hypothetical protein